MLHSIYNFIDFLIINKRYSTFIYFLIQQSRKKPCLGSRKEAFREDRGPDFLSSLPVPVPVPSRSGLVFALDSDCMQIRTYTYIDTLQSLQVSVCTQAGSEAYAVQTGLGDLCHAVLSKRKRRATQTPIDTYGCRFVLEKETLMDAVFVIGSYCTI